MSDRPTKADIDRYLDEDSLPAGEYAFVAISFCASETRQKLDQEGKVALKLRGAFRTVEEGIAHIKELHRAKESFDTYLCDMGKWTLIGNVAGIEHPETHLVDMIKAVHTKNADHKREFEERKERTKQHGLSEEDMAQYQTTAAAAEAEAPKPKTTTLSDITPIRSGTTNEDGTDDSTFCHVDTIKVPEVNVCIVSYCEPDTERCEVQTPQGCLGVKFRGAFATKAEAEAYLDSTLSKMEREVDMYVVDMYKWLLLPPAVDDIKDVKYREDYLQEMFTSYEESQKAAKLHHIEREKMAATDSITDQIMEGGSAHPAEQPSEASASQE